MNPANTVTVSVTDVEDVMVIVRELRQRNLEQGIDFDFKYNPGNTNWPSILGRCVEFYFKDPKWATIFRLTYGGII